MNEVVYLILRQMRRPALILLVAYSVAMLGISLIPTINSEGEPSYLTLFQAFYWVSYTATTWLRRDAAAVFRVAADVGGAQYLLHGAGVVLRHR